MDQQRQQKKHGKPAGCWKPKQKTIPKPKSPDSSDETEKSRKTSIIILENHIGSQPSRYGKFRKTSINPRPSKFSPKFPSPIMTSILPNLISKCESSDDLEEHDTEFYHPDSVLNHGSISPEFISKTHSSPCISPAFHISNNTYLKHNVFFSSPSKPILKSSPLLSTTPLSNLQLNNHSPVTKEEEHEVSFSDVNIIEFKLNCGTESDGVPEFGSFSLTLGEAIRGKIIDLDKYEKKRFDKLKKRAKKTLHLKKIKEEDLHTNGRNDEFFHSLTEKERIKKLKQYNGKDIIDLNDNKKETNELVLIRKSRENNEIYCNCKPLNQMSINKLQKIAEKYNIKVYKKPKKNILIKLIKNKLFQKNKKEMICCFDDECSCVKNEVNCHSGNMEGDEQCGCVKYRADCKNPNGLYSFKEPKYNQKIINEWEKHFRRHAVAGEEKQQTVVTFV